MLPNAKITVLKDLFELRKKMMNKMLDTAASKVVDLEDMFRPVKIADFILEDT